MTALFTTKNRATTVRTPRKPSFPQMLYFHWNQEGHRDGGPGKIRFSSDSGLYAITLTLEKRDGLYYSPKDVFTVAKDPTHPGVTSINCIAAPFVPAPPTEKRGKRYYPVHNQRLGCSDLALPVKTNWISYLAMSPIFLPVSNIIHFVLSIGKRRLASRNKLLNGLPNVPLRLSGVSTWIFVSCTPPHLTSLVPTRIPTTLLPLTMDSLRTY